MRRLSNKRTWARPERFERRRTYSNPQLPYPKIRWLRQIAEVLQLIVHQRRDLRSQQLAVTERHLLNQ
jgi:hypothetical protein